MHMHFQVVDRLPLVVPPVGGEFIDGNAPQGVGEGADVVGPDPPGMDGGCQQAGGHEGLQRQMVMAEGCSPARK